MTTMRLRERAAGVAGAVALTIGLATAQSAKAAEIRIAVGCPPVPACGDWVWADQLAKGLKAKGLEAKISHSGALGKDPEIIDQLSQGLLQVGLTNFVMVKQVDQTVVGFIAPYMFDSNEHMFRAMAESDIVPEVDANLQKQGLKLAGFIGVGGAVGIFNTKHPVRTVEDTRDLRLRGIDQSQIALFRAWGAKGVVVDMTEVTTSLQKGIIDGYINPPIVPIIFKQLSQLKHYTNAEIAYGFRSALMSNDWYKGLDAETRTKVDEAVAAANEHNRAWTDAAAKKEVEIMKKAGVTIVELTPEARKGFVEASRKSWEHMIPEGEVQRFVDAAENTRK